MNAIISAIEITNYIQVFIYRGRVDFILILIHFNQFKLYYLINLMRFKIILPENDSIHQFLIKKYSLYILGNLIY